MINLHRFFGDGNAISHAALEDLQSDEGARLRPFIEIVERDSDVFALPRNQRTSDGKVKLWWYVFWRHDGLDRFVADGLRAFIGPTYCDMTYAPGALQRSDSFDAQLSAEVGGTRGLRAFKFQVELAHERKVSERLGRYLELANRRPLRRSVRVRPVGRILRDFEFALLHDNAREAEACLIELRSFEHLDAQNLTYAEIRFLSRFHRSAAVLSHPGLSDAIGIGVPPAVADGILVALYEERLREKAEAGDVTSVLQISGETIAERFQPLFASARAARDARALTAFFAGLVCLGRKHPGASELAAQLPESFRGRVTALDLAHRLEPGAALPEPGDDLERARSAFDDADIDGAVRALRSAPPSLDAAKLAIQCALETRDPIVAEFAVALIDGRQDVRVALAASEHWLRRLTQVGEIVGAASRPRDPVASEKTDKADRTVRVEGWVGWFRRLAQPEDWPSALNTLQANVARWDIDELRNEGAIDEILACLKELPPWGAAMLHGALPDLVARFVLDDDRSRRVLALQAVIDALYEFLWIDDQPSIPSCQAMGELLVVRIESGLNGAEYGEKLDMFSEVLERCGAPGVVAVALDVIGTLQEVPCPSEDAQLQFFNRAAALSTRFWRRLRQEEQDYCRTLLEEVLPNVGLPEKAEAGGDDDWSTIRGRYIAIYSLQEAALERAARILEARIPDVRVEVFSNPVGGDASLRAAAKRADLFVIVTRAAKHAATEFIEAERHGDIERPVGIGTASILAAVAQWRDRLVA